MSDTNKTKGLTLTALAAEGAPSDPVVIPMEFCVLRAGINTSTKGPLLFDEVAAFNVMGAYEAHGQARLPITYEHKELNPDAPAGSGRAAGFFTPAIRDGELWATDITWTEEAKAQLSDRQWAYFSPTFWLDDAGRPVELLAISLTNIPSLDNLPQLIAADRNEAPASDTIQAPAPAAEPPAPVTLDITGTPEFVELARKHETAITELAQANERIAKFERLELERRVDDTIQAGATAKKVTPAMVATLREQGLKDPDWLARHIASLPTIAALSAAPINVAAVSSYTGKPFAELSPGERANLYRTDFDLYQALKAQDTAAKSA